MTTAATSKLRTPAFLEWIVDNLERKVGIAAALAVLLIFVIAMGQSADGLLPYDELVTLKTASLPHWGDIWRFYNNGLDTTGPLQSFVARTGLMLPIGPELGSRLPFTLAYLVMCLSIFGFVRRRYPAGYALAALIFSLNHFIFGYASEARAYSLVLAGASVAMLSWQSAISGRHRRWSLFCLWFGLAFAIDAHAYAIFLFVPFALAQFVQDLKSKKHDWAVWAALVLFPIGLLPVLHGELLAKKVYLTTFNGQPNLNFMISSYREFSGYLIGALVLALVAAGATLLQRRSGHLLPEAKTRGFSLPEWVLIAGLASLPLYVVPASYLLHHYEPRYTISFYIGLAILAIVAIAEAARRSRLVGAALFALILLASTRNRIFTFVDGINALVHPDRVHAQLQTSFDHLPWVILLEQSKLPILTDYLGFYMQLDCYAGPELTSRLYGVTDVRDLNRYSRFSGPELNFLLFNKPFSYRVADVADSIREYPHFLLVENRVDYAYYEWMPSYLIDQQNAGNALSACLGPNCVDSGINVYEVQFTKMPITAEEGASPDSTATH